MKRITLALFVIVALWVPSTADAQNRAYSDGLLWRIEGANTAPSYVFGTAHVSHPQVQAVVQNMLQTVGPLNSISLELVPTPAMQAAAAQRMFTQHGPSLSQRVGAHLFAQAVTAAMPYGLNAAVLERFKPWAAAITLSLPPSELRAQAAGQLNSEKLLAAYATNNQIALYSIETMDEQLNPFDRLSEAEQVEMLRVTLKHSQVVDQLFARLIDAYLNRDLEDFYRMMEEFSAGGQSSLQDFFERELIARRNHRMVERIQTRLAEGNALIAVGAMHLPDEVGIVRLLEKRGYTITRVPIPR